jgi:WD40 repeat protein
VLLHNLETGALEARLEHRGSVRGLWLSERLLLSACLDKRVRFFDRRSRECEFELVAHGAGVHAVQAREHLVVSVCGRPENGVRVWDMRRLPSGASSATSGTHPALLAECDAAHRSAVSCLAWDGLRLLTGSYDGHVRLWTLGATSLRACGAPIPLGADVHAVCLAGAAAVAGEESGAVHVLDFAPRARAK